MTQARAVCATFALLAMLAVPQVGMAQSQMHLSRDPAIIAIRLLLQKGAQADALAGARAIDRKKVHPREADELDFLHGLAAMRLAINQDGDKNLLDEAIIHFEAVLHRRPQLHRVRLELARSLYLRRQDERSARHFGLVLASPLPAQVVANIRRFLDAIERRKRWQPYLSLGLAPDSNINAASGENQVTLFGLPFRLDNTAVPRSGVGALVSTGIGYNRDLPGPWTLEGRADLLHREYTARDFDNSFASLEAGIRRSWGHRRSLALLVSTRRQWLGGGTNSHALGWQAEGRWNPARRLSLRVRISRHSQRHPGHPGLDGNLRERQLDAIWLWNPTTWINIATGRTDNSAQNPGARNKGNWHSLGGRKLLPLGISLGLSTERRRRKYGGSHPLAGGAARDDTLRTWRLSLSHASISWLGMVPELSWVHSTNDSNVVIRRYDRNRMELTMRSRL